jgi:hypothetical protein
MDARTPDGKILNLKTKLVRDCKVLSMMCEDVVAGDVIPVQVNSNVMKRIIYFNTFGYLENHDQMIDLLLACDYLDYEELLDYGARIVADSLKGKSTAEIRTFFAMT